MEHLRRHVLALSAALLSTTLSALAQTSIVLDGTSGNNTVSTNYNSSGGLQISLGFFADYLLVGGGGSGGTPGGAVGQNYWGTGGGGGGGVLQGNTQLLAGNYAVSVGAGGTSPSYSASTTANGVNGGNSVFGSFTAWGGGGGGGGDASSTSGEGLSGGSGGGGGNKFANSGGAGTVGQGYAGGAARNGNNSSENNRTAGGGGGGAGGAGSQGGPNSSVGGNGGIGIASTITGSSVLYGGGGGGGARDLNGGQQAGSGGSGGGGAGGTEGAAGNGTNGLGGGGGGRGADGVGGNGGSGVVIVRYQGASLGGIGGTVTSGTGTAVGYTLHTFSSTGNSSFNLSGVDMNSRLGATLSGNITGSGGLVYAGPGTLTLTGNNNWSGGTTISAGTLQIGNGGTTGDLGPTTVTNNGSLVFNRSNNLAFAQNISGTGSLTKLGAGNLTLSGTTSHTGGTTVTAGRLVGTVNSLQGDILNNSQLEFNQASNASYNSVISGTGLLIKSGAGALTLGGANTYTGGTTITGGRLAGNTTTLQGDIVNNAQVEFSQATAGSFSGNISGTGSLAKSAVGTLTLTGSNSYTGGTTVASGRLVGNTTSLQGNIANNAQVEFNQAAAGTYSGSMTGTGSLTKNGTGTLTISNSAAHTGGTTISAGRIIITASNLSGNIANNSELEINQASNGGWGGNVSGTGILIKTGAGTLSLIGSNTYTGGTTISAGRLRASTSNIQGAITNNSELEFNQLADGTMAGAITGTGSLIKTGTGNLTLAGANNYSGGTTNSLGRLIGNTSSLRGNIVNEGHLDFNQSSDGTYAGNLGGNGSLNKNGAGTLTLSGSNSFSGISAQIRINNGTLSLGSTNALGNSGTILFTGGILQFTAANTQDYSSRFSSAGGQNYRFDTNGQDVALASALNSFPASLAKTGSGTLTLTGNNTYTGGTTISAGRLVGNSASLRNAITNNSQLEFHQTTAGTYSGNLGGSGSFTKTGAGTLTLSGNNSVSGGVSIQAGALSVSSTNALGNSGTISFDGGSLQYNGSNTIDYSSRFSSAAGQQYLIDTAGRSVTYSSALTSSGGSLNKLGPGTLTLNASNTYNGGTTITGGTLATSGNERLADTGAVTVNAGAWFQAGGNETIGSLAGSGTANLRGRLTTGSSNSTFSGTMSGIGGLTKAGAGTFTLSGTTNLQGDTIVSGGNLVLNSSSALWSGGVVKLESGTLTVNQRTFVGFLDQTGGTVGGSGTLVSTLTATSSGSLDAVIADGPDFAAGILKRTGGTTTIGAANTFTGAINLQGGTLQLAEGGSFSSASSLATSSGATMDLNNKSQTFSRISGAGGTVSLGTGNLTINQSSESEFGGSITGSGGLTKSGSGNLTLTGASTYLGDTTVAAGQLTVDGSIASAATIQSGARLTGSGRVGGLIINSGATVNPGNSPGTLSVDGNAVWNAGGNYDWESLAINTDETDQTAAGSSWDFMDITGTLTLGSLSIGSPFNLNLTSLSSSTTAGDIVDWDPAVGSTWLIARAAGGIYLDAALVSAGSNYSSLFNINTTGWSGGLPVGGFQVITLGNTTDLYLQAIGSAAVPEPGQIAASLLLLAGIGGYVWVQRRKGAKKKNAVA